MSVRSDHRRRGREEGGRCVTSILIAGVGGQGTLLASVVLGRVAVSQGLDVKLSEVHGMAQRGGSVVTYVRIADPGGKVFSPLIEENGADILLAFEEMEAVRWLSYVKPETGRVYTNSQQIYPMSVVTGQSTYPGDLKEYIRSRFPSAVILDALSLAEQAGNARTVNTVLLGAMASGTDFPKDVWLNAVGSTVKPAFLEANEKAFELGFAEAAAGSRAEPV